MRKSAKRVRFQRGKGGLRADFIYEAREALDGEADAVNARRITHAHEAREERRRHIASKHTPLGLLHHAELLT